MIVRWRRVLAGLAGITALVAVPVAATPAAVARPSPVRIGTVPFIGRDASRLGPLRASTLIHFDVVLEPRQPGELSALATAVSTPGNPLYRHYLPRGRLATAFGPTAAAIRSVTADLRAAGLTIGAISADHLTIPVSGPAAKVAAAFSTGFERYRLSNGRVGFANIQPLLLRWGAARYVQEVVGLDTLDVPQPVGLAASALRQAPVHRLASDVVTGGPQPCSTAKSAAPRVGAYTADQLATAYSFSGLYGAGDRGSGVTVALFELAPDVASDIAAYQACYRTAALVTYTEVDGGAGSSPGSSEPALDIENVIGLAPKASIDVYEGPDSSVGSLDTYQQIVDGDTAQVISTSWGYCETQAASVQAENTLFEMAATQGQSTFAAAGDLGSEGCGPGTLSVDDPGSQPYVTGVGGTELLTADPPPVQYVWNTDGGSGAGGVSALWTMPPYQKKAPKLLGVINGYSSGSPCDVVSGSYCREVPDVSADAASSTGYLIFYNGSWSAIAGTSGAAPLWAAYAALVDASAACAAVPIGFANPALYSAAAVSYASDFGDVTIGDNDLQRTNQGRYPALAGYDMASGLGSPVGDSLEESLCRGGGSAGSVTVTSPGTQISRAGSPVDLQVAARGPEGKVLTFSAIGLPKGLSMSPTGEIRGAPTATGSFSVAVTAADAAGRSGTAEFVWNVIAHGADIVTVTSPGPQTSEPGASIDMQMSATDSGGRPLTYSATGLPGSLQLDPATGEITGPITGAIGVHEVQFGASDSTGASGSVTFTWLVIVPDEVMVTDPGQQATVVGSAVNMQIAAKDAAGLYLYFSATGLPKGLSINRSGTIGGAPTTRESRTVTVSATDTDGQTSSATFSWQITS